VGGAEVAGDADGTVAARPAVGAQQEPPGSFDVVTKPQ
jgi:hypothetical protein